jgi:2-polyprenyl-3-methyl-5-hydroxy-6-metoxy-1,4-benzoquinol methylase
MQFEESDKYPSFAKLIAAVLSIWPEHDRYLETSVTGRDTELLSHSDRLSGMILRLATDIEGGLTTLANDYRFLCEQIVLPEEWHFRRHGKYRLTTFEEAFRTVYNDPVFMTRYMNGLLLSDVLWVNHCRGLQHYAQRFLRGLKPGSDFLEIGPGHGLLLYLACETPNIGHIYAWDVSQASLDMSRHSLQKLGASRMANFEKRNIFDPSIMDPANAALFDAIVLSEVLEHLEDPEQAIRVLRHLCKPGGRVWINVPANSPAPDHLYLVKNPEQAEKLVRDVGFNVVDTAHYPMTGVSLDRAIRRALTITCIVVGERASA